MTPPAPEVEAGWVAADLAAEFPELRLHYVALDARSGRSPEAVRARLRNLADRYTGGKAVTLRQQPIPWAYRVFFRQVGIDPDEHRTPPEAIALERMRAGGFPSQNLLDDALTIATVETGVPIVAFDEDKLDGPLGLRMSRPRELLGGDGRPLSSRQVVIADAERAVGVLFADLAEGRGVHPDTERMRVASIQVKGVPDVSVEEALWIVVEVLQGQP
ncbi:MAG TPA: phenylalanine--tRNA ligase beta subunit-related protein [Thermoleophilaceae bacterium]|nr:phenylalanine--tRNA ligase beta subunit-related protein [Thermoleophilaceae bacterium]